MTCLVFSSPSSKPKFSFKHAVSLRLLQGEVTGTGKHKGGSSSLRALPCVSVNPRIFGTHLPSSSCGDFFLNPPFFWLLPQELDVANQEVLPAGKQRSERVLVAQGKSSGEISLVLKHGHNSQGTAIANTGVGS